jgi:hypothetical protein
MYNSLSHREQMLILNVIMYPCGYGGIYNYKVFLSLLYLLQNTMIP